MNEFIGWYINRGPLGIPHLRKERALCLEKGDHFKLQFDNKELPECYTHGWRTFYKTEVLILLEQTEEMVLLQYNGKQYRRSICNSKFQFHNTELTL